jgi:C1A family cysteine protease
MIALGIVVILVVCIVFTNESIVGGPSAALAGHYSFNVPIHFADDVQTSQPQDLSNVRAGTFHSQATMKELKNMSTRIGPIFDQGPLGSCVANALIAAFDYIDESPVGSRLFL